MEQSEVTRLVSIVFPGLSGLVIEAEDNGAAIRVRVRTRDEP